MPKAKMTAAEIAAALGSDEKNAYLKGYAEEHGATVESLGIKPEDFEKWVAEEMAEHTTDRDTAARITLDHVARHGLYYYPEMEKAEQRAYRRQAFPDSKDNDTEEKDGGA